MSKRKQFPIYLNWQDAVELMSPEEVKQMVIYMMGFYSEGIIPNPDSPMLKMFFADKLQHMIKLEDDRLKKLQESPRVSKETPRVSREAVNVDVGVPVDVKVPRVHVPVDVPVNVEVASFSSNVDVPGSESYKRLPREEKEQIFDKVFNL